MQRKSYFINSFYFLKPLFEAHLSDYFNFSYTPSFQKLVKPTPARFFIPRNYLQLKRLYLTGQVAKYDIIHFNRPESFLAFKKYPGQLSIFEIHGFDVGVMGQRYLRDLHTPWKVWLGTFLDRLIEKKIIKKLQLPDLLYVSTPDLVEPIAQWCGRKPQWLPNPVDTEQFTPEGPVKKLDGSPAVFLAARLHGDKKPEVAFDIFKNDILPKYPHAVLHLLETGELVEKYKKETAGNPHYHWLPYMTKPELASVIRGADLVFGDFSIGALSLLPMQVMLSKRPLVTLDNYETVKTPIEGLPALALRLLSDEQFRKETVEKNYRYVMDVHAPKSVCETHLANLKQFLH
jgi:glycosyltransferase involved in cell wall biosynthesis